MEVVLVVVVLSTGHQNVIEIHQIDKAHSLANFLTE